MADKKVDTNKLDSMVKNLKERGTSLPRNTARARIAAAEMHGMAVTRGELQRTVEGSAPSRDVKEIEEQTRLIRAMGSQRSASRRYSASSTTTGGDVHAAIPRFYDPMEYWDLSGLPWNMADEGHRHKLHKWLRLFYATHYLIPILIDIFTRFPLVGMRLESKDKKLTGFYEDLFLDSLNYPEFLVQLGREFWTVGEAFPLGHFNESLGIWEQEEILNPEMVVIENFPLLDSRQLKITPPDYLKKLAKEKSPAKEYKMLTEGFPEIIPYLLKDEHIPISGVLLKQVANKLTSWDDHGTPILLRGLRTLIHEEKLLASQDAIAERLYSPLILAKLGIMDLGDGQGAWVPSPDELDAFRDDMDMALASDFRLLVHHFGLDVTNVFGREQMPRLGDDFDRIERRLMQVFGVNPSLLSAGSASQPYASSALQAEFLNQILKTFQDYLKRHFRARALVVAEAQEHWDYEVRGDTRIELKEEVVEYDEEGNELIKVKNKLMVPELEFATLDLRDEATERQFLQTLRAMGVPIPDQKLMIGIERDIDDWTDEYNDELAKKTIKQQEAKMKVYQALKAANLPIPPDLKSEVEQVTGPDQGGGMASPGGLPGGGGGPGMGGPGMGPAGGPGPGGPGESVVMPPAPPGLMGPGGMGGAVPGGGPPPASPMNPGQSPNVPAVSMERRPGMPTASIKDSDGDSNSENEDKERDNEKTAETEAPQTEEITRLPRNRLSKEERKSKYRIVEPELSDEQSDKQSG